MGQKNVLVIKLGYSELLHDEIYSRNPSLGDVFRSTPLLHLFKDYHVTWVTDEKALPLLEGNPFIDRLLVLDWITEKQLRREYFEILINLEKDPGFGVLANQINARIKYGFRVELDNGLLQTDVYEKGFPVMEISANKKYKKQNTKFFQELLYSMIGKDWKEEEYVLGYEPKKLKEFDIAFNTLVGIKWPTKAWSDKHWSELERMLISKGLTVSRQEEQGESITKNLYSYMDWINSCKGVFVTQDSLGLHLALAMKKKVIGLFGSTPDREICFYGRGHALIPEKDLDCRPCMAQKCWKSEKCIDLITPQRVDKSITELLKKD